MTKKQMIRLSAIAVATVVAWIAFTLPICQSPDGNRVRRLQSAGILSQIAIAVAFYPEDNNGELPPNLAALQLKREGKGQKFEHLGVNRTSLRQFGRMLTEFLAAE